MNKEYLIKLNSHVHYVGPAIEESEISHFLEQRKLKRESVDILRLNQSVLKLYQEMKW